MDYRIQRLKEDLTNAQQRNKKQRIQLANYKKVHERDLETIKKYKEVFDKAIEYIEYCKTSKNDIFPIIEEAKMKEILKGIEKEK